MNQKFDFLTNSLEELKTKALSEPAIESKLAESFELSSKVAQLTDEVNNNLLPQLHFFKNHFSFKKKIIYEKNNDIYIFFFKVKVS